MGGGGGRLVEESVGEEGRGDRLSLRIAESGMEINEWEKEKKEE